MFCCIRSAFSSLWLVDNNIQIQLTFRLNFNPYPLSYDYCWFTLSRVNQRRKYENKTPIETNKINAISSECLFQCAMLTLESNPWSDAIEPAGARIETTQFSVDENKMERNGFVLVNRNMLNLPPIYFYWSLTQWWLACQFIIHLYSTFFVLLSVHFRFENRNSEKCHSISSEMEAFSWLHSRHTHSPAAVHHSPIRFGLHLFAAYAYF